MGYWGSFDFAFAFAVLYFCWIQCFCHLVAEKRFEIKVNEVDIFKLSFVFSPFRTPGKKIINII